jgi:hypothetical protein
LLSLFIFSSICFSFNMMIPLKLFYRLISIYDTIGGYGMMNGIFVGGIIG